MPLLIHRIANSRPVSEDAALFINSLRPEPHGVFRVRSQRFDSVQFVTTLVPDSRDTTQQRVMFEAYILYYED